MATTKIWPVRSRIDHVINYVLNHDKTENEGFSETPTEGETLEALTGYVTQVDKIKQPFFVTGLNCLPETAVQEMKLTKKQYHKEGGILAFHGYQSFAPGEVTPEQAHEIGVKLAKELWGNRFEVIIATHQDRQHLHNHFVLNSVSFKDGKKFYASKATYQEMRDVSDQLCRDYKLRVIEQPEPGKAMHYREWQARQEGEDTWRGLIFQDIDDVIKESVTLRQFFFRMRQKGYAFKPNAKYFTLKPPGKERFVRIDRKYPEYSLEKIEARIYAQEKIKRHQPGPGVIQKKMKLQGNFQKVKKTGGLRGLYLHYCYRLGVFEKRKNKKRDTAHLNFVYREDIRKLEQITDETSFLCHHKMDSLEDLQAFKASTQEKIKAQCIARKQLRNQLRTVKDEPQRSELLNQAAERSVQIKKLRKAVRLCESIEERAVSLREKMNAAKAEAEKSKNEKEVKPIEH
ncbi:hypothetical protein EUCA11A_35020 [Eubacterium callanderi]|uniref:relaxase/mobilization nuclease domain-containing protein n=1 Tax=Eubacterium callanderi TaxID=53442 RepID=UPI0029FEECED|nr:relaxase/mobilization nuclease domain-containing protein [Eubacterium callanderi]WPK69314.1 hypothetical protein EUCA2A_35020 [Eubacterium callanderi]WPK73612.1 hypothetical protein EUCA11A_35020 [Eubacterium callanderi]